MLDVPTRNEALLDLLFTNQEHLFCNISVSDSLGCSDDNIVEFRILLSMLKVSSKTRVLDFGRANFSWEGFDGKLPWKTKELVSAGSSARTLSWKHKANLSPTKEREVS